MHLADIRTLFDYSTWATDRLLDQAAHLTPEEFTTPQGANLPGVRDILAHTLIAQLLWRTRFETGTSDIAVTPTDFPDVGSLRQRWQEERAAMRAHLDTLTDDDLARAVRFERRGQTAEMTRWHILFQLVNHSTQHRAEVAAILTDLGHSPGDLDFIFYAMQAERAA